MSKIKMLNQVWHRILYSCIHLAIKHPVPDRVKPSFVIFDIWAL